MFNMQMHLLGRVLLRYPILHRCSRSLSNTVDVTTTQFDNFLDMDQLVDSIGLDVRDKNKGLSFSRMLRESKLIQLGDIDGRVVIGKIVHRMHDDIYIDVGLKFNAVCKVPAVNEDSYHVGARVIVRLHDLELSERFLGSKKDLTLLEADATLIRSVRSGPPKKEVGKEAGIRKEAD